MKALQIFYKILPIPPAIWSLNEQQFINRIVGSNPDKRFLAHRFIELYNMLHILPRLKDYIDIDDLNEMLRAVRFQNFNFELYHTVTFGTVTYKNDMADSATGTSIFDYRLTSDGTTVSVTRNQESFSVPYSDPLDVDANLRLNNLTSTFTSKVVLYLKIPNLIPFDTSSFMTEREGQFKDLWLDAPEVYKFPLAFLSLNE